MYDRRPGRFLAPLALVGVIAALFLILGGESKDEGGTSKAPTTAKTAAEKPKEKPFYRVKPGDLLSSISEDTGVPVETLVELNPEIDPNALQSGQLIRLRR